MAAGIFLAAFFGFEAYRDSGSKLNFYAQGNEVQTYVHLLRLPASLLILFTIVDKHRFFHPKKSFSRTSKEPA